MLNQENNVVINSDSKSIDIKKNTILNDDKSLIVTGNNEMASIHVINDKDIDHKESCNNDLPVLLEESIIEKKSLKNRKKTSKKQKRSKSKKIYEAIEHNSILESITTQHDNSNIKNDEIFGEKIESLHERLKKVSPFGNFNTFKLFKVIIKNGEDLRQEQFATQLINEFYQIFQLEEVDIWLKPYEILSTGNNVGLIECVPNSISLDYLKRKSKNINNLSQFYETYFGPIDSESKIK